MPPPSKSPDLKTRVITCLNKLSDRDTHAIATNELESIARALSAADEFAVFLTAVSATDSSEKSPVRRQCVRILSVLSASHGDSLSPHLSKLLAAVLRRVRDPDTAVRTACVDAVACISCHVTLPPFSLISKPLFECLFREQDYNAQIGAALCLAAGIEASPEPETSELKKLVPRLLKLVKNDSFKAKPALISLIGSIAGVGGCSGRNVVSNLVPALVEFLGSDEWQARKAAAEALGRLAAAEGDLLSEFKSFCLGSIESKRFDKVKLVRETMNSAIELWREVPGVSDDVSNDAESMSSSKDNGRDDIVGTPQQKRAISRIRSPASGKSSNSSPKPKASRSLRVGSWKTSDNNLVESKSQKLEFSDSDSIYSGSCEGSKVEVKCSPFNRSSDEREREFSGSESMANRVDINTVDDAAERQKEFENISLVQKQLLQIENQQSSLLDLLQTFIGHSQNGMNSLEQRVNGLEIALDEISHLAMTTGKNPNAGDSGNSCCILSPKFWRKAEGGSYGNSKVSSFTPKKHQVGIMSELEFPESMQKQTGQFWDHSHKRAVRCRDYGLVMNQ